MQWTYSFLPWSRASLARVWGCTVGPREASVGGRVGGAFVGREVVACGGIRDGYLRMVPFAVRAAFEVEEPMFEAVVVVQWLWEMWGDNEIMVVEYIEEPSARNNFDAITTWHRSIAAWHLHKMENWEVPSIINSWKYGAVNWKQVISFIAAPLTHKKQFRRGVWLASPLYIMRIIQCFTKISDCAKCVEWVDGVSKQV
jgi:hypothetical protein